MTATPTFDQMQKFTDERMTAVQNELTSRLRSERAAAALKNVCIYATGSGGRGELTPMSDIDLFIVRVGPKPSVPSELEPHRLDLMLIQGVIVEAFAALGLERPSNGGEFLELHTSSGLCQQIGAGTDDPSNTFTARMLLLLESRPLVGVDEHKKLIEEVVKQYWENWLRFKDGGRENQYLPFLLVNDVVRFWRVLLLSYVAKNIKKDKKDTMDSEKGLRSFKLRFARCLTCYSILLEFLHLERQKEPFSPENILPIVYRKPVERLKELESSYTSEVGRLLRMYDEFLSVTALSDVKEQFADSDFRKRRVNVDGQRFGDEIFKLMMTISGGNSPLLRHIVV